MWHCVKTPGRCLPDFAGCWLAVVHLLLCFPITHLPMASFRSAQRKPYSVRSSYIHLPKPNLNALATTASFTEGRRGRPVATRQGSNGSSKDEKRCNSCTNSTCSISQQQARGLKSSLRNYPKRSHCTLPLLSFSNIPSLIKTSSRYLDKLGRSFVSHYLGYDTQPSFP